LPRERDSVVSTTKAIREVEAVVETMRAEHDPLASRIFVSRRHYQNLSDTKGGKRRETNARSVLRDWRIPSLMLQQCIFVVARFEFFW
jgi:hypothetical protein